MGWEAWLTFATIAVALFVMARDLASPVVTILGALLLLLVAGILEPGEALAGFANPAPFTVAALYVLARAVDKTGALQPLVAVALTGRGSRRMALLRLLVPSAAASAFLNNTPIVAMLAPQIATWAERHGVSPSRFLMPLSFAVILGGVVTTIGTSTNLVVSGLLEARGLPPFALFEMTRLGLPVAAIGIAAVVLLAPWVLPDRRSARSEAQTGSKEFLVGMVVVAGGPLDGRSVAAGGLRHLQGVFLVEIEREGEVIAPVAPDAILRGGDRLRFAGRADLVVDLQRTRGLVSSEAPFLDGLDAPGHTFFEAVIGEGSPLAGKTLREARFRGRYQAAVVAIHRAGQRVQAKLGEVPLAPGDSLLLLADPGFRERWRDRGDFLLVAHQGGDPPASTRKAPLVGAIGLAVVVVAGGGWLPILEASLLAAAALVALRVLTPGEARDSVQLDVVLVVAASLGLGVAIERSGLADALADSMVVAFDAYGRVGVLLGVVLGTMALTELITNNAAAAVVFPIAFSAAERVGADPRTFAVAVAVAASASFLTPIGYQTNTMVYAAGGYRFGDYARLGAPLSILVVIALLVAV
jgi:di/tricarboxylate transporter